jgi:ABC-2 type transport system permease protein
VLIVGSFFLLKDKLIYVFEWQNLLFITLFLGLAFILRFLLAYLVGVSTFWTIEFEGSANFYENILPILAGLVFPFNLIQGTTLHLIMTHLPWSFIVYHPVQIYLGKYTPLQSLQAFVIGLLWALFLFYFSNLIFKLGLKKNESVGL